MHYKDGTEAKLGDLVNYPATVYEPTSPTTSTQNSIQRQGHVVSLYPSADSCNVGIATAFIQRHGGEHNPGIPLITISVYTGNAKDCELVARQL